ncbi:hypothetical protein DTL42_18570 [Bremerella cremea]|uniref:Transposase n=1 Tax=Bremerella cremea TaxID=1031537 RepID=A0A368KMV4_9BACT|nr:hypothetical protein DTL42_18570 [Bremerella cremea]
MSDQSNASAAEVQSKLQHLNSLLLDLLLPAEKVAAICREIDFAFRDRVYTPMVTVWMFITQVLSADHSCQQAVARLNGWRAAQGLSRCSSETTSYCKARKRLPEALFERLLAWIALQCNEATVDKWLFHGREVDLVDGTRRTSLFTGDRRGKTIDAVGQPANNHSRTESRQQPKPQRTPPDLTPPETIQAPAVSPKVDQYPGGYNEFEVKLVTFEPGTFSSLRLNHYVSSNRKRFGRSSDGLPIGSGYLLIQSSHFEKSSPKSLPVKRFSEAYAWALGRCSRLPFGISCLKFASNNSNGPIRLI